MIMLVSDVKLQLWFDRQLENFNDNLKNATRQSW